MKKKYVFLMWVVFAIIIGVAFDITDYLIENNLLTRWYVCLIEFMFLVLGWVGARLEIKLSKNKNNKKIIKK